MRTSPGGARGGIRSGPRLQGLIPATAVPFRPDRHPGPPYRSELCIFRERPVRRTGRSAGRVPPLAYGELNGLLTD
ncbi:hypothetical protein DEJ50_21230 [Streptomyces venezuelae]|uniref:Uncharacterized protein n=1 Tax=Streptomyces venezuelae TaxID=54571 RepID=A0A5P2DH05_STRVZ|nr:hypothetical protein DEJ50_21230 [Streptomyces venezuelae]